MFLQLLSADCFQWVEETGKWAEPKHFFLSFCLQGISPLQLAGWLYPRVINELAFKQGQQIRSPYSRSAGK